MKANNLYFAFHGANPKVRRVKYVAPKEPLIKIGRLVSLEYIPERPSRKAGTRFSHEMGDTGVRMLSSNCVLCTDKEGRNLYIIKDKGGSRPKFESRGIIG